jgi:hypothetical protein
MYATNNSTEKRTAPEEGQQKKKIKALRMVEYMRRGVDTGGRKAC